MPANSCAVYKLFLGIFFIFLKITFLLKEKYDTFSFCLSANFSSVWTFSNVQSENVKGPFKDKEVKLDILMH